MLQSVERSAKQSRTQFGKGHGLNPLQPPEVESDADAADQWSCESHLLDALLAGDEQAFDHLAAEYFPKVYRFVLRRLGEEDLTRDLVQTALGKAMHKLPGFRRESSLLTWLCACANNEIRMHLRRKSRSRQVDLDEERLEAMPERPEDAAVSWGPRAVPPDAGFLQAERREMVHEALDRLPEKNAIALQMKYLDSQPVAEIAATLDLTPKAAESLLSRSREAFRREFERLLSTPLVGRAPVE